MSVKKTGTCPVGEIPEQAGERQARSVPDVVQITDPADATTFLTHARTVRQNNSRMMTAMLGAAGLDGTEFLQFLRLTLISSDGPGHRDNRRFGMQFISDCLRQWPSERIAAEYSELLLSASGRDTVDLNHDLSATLVCRILKDSFGTDTDTILELVNLTEPLLTSLLEYGLPRIKEVRKFTEDCRKAAEILNGLSFAYPQGPDLEETDAKILAAIVALPASKMLIEVLNRTQVQLLTDPDLKLRLRKDPTAIPAFVRKSIIDATPIQNSYPATVREDITLPSGARLQAGDLALCPLREVNARVALTMGEYAQKLGLSFGAGRHRCIGASLSVSVLNAALASLVAGFDLADRGALETTKTSAGVWFANFPVSVSKTVD
jgi:cytochrome P450